MNKKEAEKNPERRNRHDPERIILLYLADVLILVLVWGGYYRCRLADSDTLWGEFIPSNTLIARLTNFRWLGFVGDFVSYHVFHYYPFEHQRISLFLFLIVLALCLLLVQKTFAPFMVRLLDTLQGKLAYYGAVSLIFVNVLFAEHFYFTDAFLNFKSAFFFCTAGCFLWSRKHYGWGTLFIFFSSMFYQVTCADAALILMTLVFLEEKGHLSGKLLKREILVILVPLGAGILNYASGPLLLKWINSFTGWDLSAAKEVRTVSFGQSVWEAGRSFSNLYESSLGLMIPVWLPLIFSVLVTAVVFAVLIRNRKWNETGAYGLYKIGTFIVMSALQIMSSTWEFTPRIISTFYFMQSMNAVIMLSLCGFCLAGMDRREDISAERHSCLQKSLVLLPVLYLCAQAFFIQIIIANRCVSETLDTVYASAILDKVEEYEAETGNVVTRMTFCNDAASDPYYPEVQFHSSAINKRLYGNGTYSLIETMAVQRGRSFDVVYEEESDVLSMFEGKNWDSFNPDEQVAFVNDMLYVCVF